MIAPAKLPPKMLPYVRVSGDRSRRSGLGEEAQHETLTAYFNYKLKGQGVEWGGKFYPDLAVSASKVYFLDRDAGSDLNLDAQRGDHVVVAKMDRMIRSLKDFVTLTEFFEGRGVFLHVLDVGYDNSSSVGNAVAKMLRNMLAVMAQFESDRGSERMKEAKAVARAAGKPVQGHPPLGFVIKGKPGERYFVPDEYEQGLCKQIVAWRKLGYSWAVIDKHMRVQNIKNQHTRRPWNNCRIRRGYDAGLQFLGEKVNGLEAPSPA